MKKKLNITFVNPNTEEQIVQAIAGILAYNLAENNKYIKFSCQDKNFQNSKKKIEGELELFKNV